METSEILKGRAKCTRIVLNLISKHYENSLPDDIRIYIVYGKIDIRKSIDGLSAIDGQILINIELGIFNEAEKKWIHLCLNLFYLKNL